MNIKKLAVAMGLGLSMTMAAGMANAYSYWQFEDDDIDFILDPDTLEAKVTGEIEKDDLFVSIFEISSFSKNLVPSIPNGKELTGVAVVQLLNEPTIVIDLPNPDFDPTLPPGPGNEPTIPTEIPNPAGLQYGAYSGGFDAILGLGSSGATLGAGLGEAGDEGLVAMWFNGAPGASGDRDLELKATINPATNCTSLADCITQASLGDLYQVDGFTGDPDEFWSAASAVGLTGFDLAAVLDSNNTLPVATVAFGLGNMFNAEGMIAYQDLNGNFCGYVDAPGCVQFVGSATLYGGDGLENGNGAVAHSDFQGNKYQYIIPEPSVVLLLGAGLLGMGAGLRKRKA